MLERIRRMLIIALAVLGLDQLTKALALNYLAGEPGVVIIPGFAELVLVFNRGAAFGSFSNLPYSKYLLTGVTLIALGAVAWIILGKAGRSRAMQVLLGLVAGGALGNLVDRIRLGKVVDFVSLHAGSWYWPTFNVADMALTFGGIGLAWLLIRGKV